MLQDAFQEQLRKTQRAINESLAKEDPALWDWYGGSCPCGLEPGDCKVHKQAREAQRPPEGDWRTWAYIAGRAGRAKPRREPNGFKSG